MYISAYILLLVFSCSIFSAARGVDSRTTNLTEVSIVAPDNSIAANFLAFGATIKNLWVRDKFGGWRDIVLGFDNVSDYTDQKKFGRQFFGPVVGRYANRIKNATFSIPPSIDPPANGSNVFHVPANEHNGVDSLHGGFDGYDLRLWNVTERSKDSVTFSLHDPNGTQGFPGNQLTHVTYRLETGARWKITMRATVDSESPIMLSSHTFWNLDAYHGSSNLDHHFVQFHASRYIQTDGILVPNGTIGSTSGTPLDFSIAKSLGAAINKTAGMDLCGTGCTGLDNCWLYDHPQSKTPMFSIWSNVSGIRLDVMTNQIGLQIYTCNGINIGALKIPRKRSQGRSGTFYDNHSCLAIEQESAIAAINYPGWGINQIYGPNRTYEWNAEYAFTTIQ